MYHYAITPIHMEQYAISVLKDFYQGAFPAFEAVDIERLVTEYMNLKIRYEKLSDDGKILGVTAYQESTLKINRNGRWEFIQLFPDTILIESSLKEIHKNKGRLRFTLAHECSHQLLFKLFPTEAAASYRKAVTTEAVCTVGQLREAMNWSEHRANELAAALLMPGDLLEMVQNRFHNNKRLILYGTCLRRSEKQCLTDMAIFLGVSKQALMIRLKELHLIDVRPQMDFVVAEECEQYG